MATHKFILNDRDEVISRVMVYDPLEANSTRGGEIVIASEQDATRIIEANRRARDTDQRKNHFRLVARIPLSVYERAIREGWQHDEAKWKRFLNDPDNAAFRTTWGNV